MNFALGFGYSLLRLVLGLLDVYTWIIIIRALLSWVNPDPYNPIVQILYRITEPVLRPFRRLLPPRKLGGLDVSPMVVILLVQFVKYGLVYSFTAAALAP